MRLTRPLLALFVLLAIALRVGAIAYTHALNAPAEENRIIARNLASGRGFTFTEFGITGPTAIRGPAYPMLLAIVGPDRTGVILAINVLAGAATALAAFTLTRRLLFPPPLVGGGRGRGRAAVLSGPQLAGHQMLAEYGQGDPSPHPLPQGEGVQKFTALLSSRSNTLAPLLAAALFAAWPTQVYAATLTQGLPLAVLLTLASLTLAFRRTPVATLIAGLLAGLAALTEPVLALPLLLVAIVLGWRTIDRDNRRRWHWPDAALFVAAGCVLIAPWLYRNAVVFGGPMPITSNFWRDAFLGNGDGATGSRSIRSRIVDDDGFLHARTVTRIETLPPNVFDQLKTAEPQRIALFRSQSLEWIHGHPARYLKLCLLRLGKTYFSDTGHSATIIELYMFPRLAAAFGLLFLLHPRYPTTARLVLLVLVIGLLLATVLTASEIRMALLMDVPQLLAIALSAVVLQSPLPCTDGRGDQPSGR